MFCYSVGKHSTRVSHLIPQGWALWIPPMLIQTHLASEGLDVAMYAPLELPLGVCRNGNVCPCLRQALIQQRKELLPTTVVDVKPSLVDCDFLNESGRFRLWRRCGTSPALHNLCHCRFRHLVFLNVPSTFANINSRFQTKLKVKREGGKVLNSSNTLGNPRHY